MKATAAKPAVGGAVSYAGITATLPTDAVTEPTGFNNVGYISEDGVSRSQDVDNDVIKAWGGDVVLVLEKGKTEKFKFVMIEPTNIAALKLVNGDDSVTGTSLEEGISVASNSKAKGAHAFVIDMIEAENTLHRICIPKGVVSAIGDTEYKDSGAIGYDVEVTAIADEAGNTCYEYFKTAPANAAPAGGESTGNGEG